MSKGIEIRPLDAPFGAEILGLDVTGRDTSWHAALASHQLLVAREVVLEADDQVALLETLGPPLVENPAGRAYQFVSNSHVEGILGDGRFAYHSDHAFMPDPIDVISLYALELPAAGSQTRFVNAKRASEALPPILRTRIGDRYARHVIDPTAPSGRVAIDSRRSSDDLPHANHPILSIHPRTGDEILYVNEQQTDRIDGLAASESDELLRALFDHLYSGAFGYVHEWQPNDLLIWDNFALQHARDAIPPDTHRTLRRVSIGGTSVYAFFEAHEKWSFKEGTAR